MYKVLIVADADLDGTGSATIITKYYEIFYSSKIPFKKGTQVEVMFPSREELNDLFLDARGCKGIVAEYDHIYLCDTAPNSSEACANIGTIVAPKLTIFDHHETNLKRLEPYRSNFTAPAPAGMHIVEGGRCSAQVAFDTLFFHAKANIFSKSPHHFDVLRKFAWLVNDLDMWYRKVPRSTDLADYVAIVGAKAAYPVLLKACIDPDTNVGDMEEVLNTVKKQKECSLALARSTLVKHRGYKSPFYTCLVDDWSSWVAAELVAKTGLIAMFDIARKSLSFRVGPKYVGMEWHRAKEPKPNCLDFAEPLGGGGHPQAAGVSTGEASPIFKQLSQKLGEILLENFNE